MISMVAPRLAVSDEDAEALWLSSQDDELFLSELRRRGAFKVESIRAIRRVKDIGLDKAKEIVHFSQAWSDTRVADDAVHESFFEALEILQREEASALPEKIAS